MQYPSPASSGSPSCRLAAVWFADIVGFTRLSSQNEGAALRLVDLLQEIARQEVDRHGAILVKFTGDGVLAYAVSTASAIDAALAVRAIAAPTSPWPRRSPT